MFANMLGALRSQDLAGFDNHVSILRFDRELEIEFNDFVDGLLVGYATTPGFHETPGYDQDHFTLSSVGEVQASFTKVIPDGQCHQVFTSINLRVACVGIFPSTLNPSVSLDNAINSLLSTKVNNWKTLNCHYTKLASGSSDYYCEVGIRDASSIVKQNNKPTLTDKGSDVYVEENKIAGLMAGVTDVDGDLVVGYWQQKSGVLVPLSDTHYQKYFDTFSAVVSPLPDVTKPEILVFEYIADDGKDEVRMEHTLTVLPKGAIKPMLPTAKAASAEIYEGDAVTLVGGVADATAVTFAWEQLEGPTVVLSSAGSDAKFTAPSASQLKFRLTAKRWGQTETAEVLVTVKAKKEAVITPPPPPPAPASGGGGGAIEWWFAAALFLLTGAARQRRAV